MLKVFRLPSLLNLILVCLLALALYPQRVQAGPATSRSVYFTPNQGQWADSILFRGQAPGGTLWFTRTHVYYHFTREVDTTWSFRLSPRERASGGRNLAHVQTRAEHLLLSTELAGSSNESITLVGEGEPLGRSNYFLGDDPTRWQSNLPNYPSIIYQDVYPGIDLRYRNAGGRLEYDFLVAPGADPSVIRMQLSGSQTVRLDPDGQLALRTDWGSVKQESPRVYHVSGSDTTWMAARFVITGDQTIGFDFDRSESANLALVIDPTIQLCTYLGGSGDDVGSDPNGTRPSVCVNSGGEILLTGYTKSADFPVINALDGSLEGTKDIFVTKLNSTGATQVFSTYIGGNSDEYSFAIATDNLNNIYVTGTTFSSNFPVVDAVQPFPGGQGDAYLVKLQDDGSAISYGTYYGGTIGTDWASGLCVDPAGNQVWISGDVYTGSPSDFPTTLGVVQTTWAGGTGDCFVIKFNPTQPGASSLTWATLLGGNAEDGGALVSLSPGGDLCLTGMSKSGNFPGTLGGASGDYDVVYAVLASDASSVSYARYIGGLLFEQPLALAFDNSGYAYITGWTYSNNFPTAGTPADDTRNGATDGFVVKLPTLGGALFKTTLIGGLGGDEGRYLQLDPAGRVIVAGYSDGNQLLEVSPLQAGKGALADAFLTVVAPDFSSYEFSTYIGGNGNDWVRGLARTSSGDMLLVGYTESTDLPVTGGAYDPSYNGSGDAFVMQVSNIDNDYDGVLNGDDNCLNVANPGQEDDDGDAIGSSCDPCPLDIFNDFDADGVCEQTDNCDFNPNPGQEDDDLDNIGNVCDVGENSHFDIYASAGNTSVLSRLLGAVTGESAIIDSSLMHMVLTDPAGDSIGPGFNTIGLGSSYDSTQDLNSPQLTGPDGRPDLRINIPATISGPYSVRLIRAAGSSDSVRFTLTIRIDGNQQLVPDGYHDASVSSLGTTLPETYVWVASTILTGDFNGDGNYTSADIILLVNEAFKSGPPPTPASVADVNCSGSVTSADIIILVNHVFKSGPAPCSGSAG